MLLSIWEFFVIPLYAIMYCILYVCFDVCNLWVNILQAFTQAFSGACSWLCMWDFILVFCYMYLQSFNYCLVSYCPVLHFRTEHCSLEGHILFERGDRRISEYIKSQYKRICVWLRLYIYKIPIMQKYWISLVGHMYELLSSMTNSRQCIKFKLGASNCGQ